MIKLVQITFRFEYSDAVEEMLDQLEISDYARYSMMEGKTCDGKHYGSQVFPGNLSIIQAQVPEEVVDRLFEMLAKFRKAKPAHRHIQALVLPVEKVL